MAQIARAERPPSTTKDTGGDAADLHQRAADQVAKAAADATGRVEEATRWGARTFQDAARAAGEAEGEAAQRSAEGAADLGRAFVELASEQARQNVETLKALTGAVDWNQVAKAVDWQQVLQIQSAYLRASLERTVRFNRHCLQASQALMTSAASATQRQAKKAA